MSALSSPIGTPLADSWPAARVVAGLSAVPVGHALDLALFFPDAAQDRHDALIAETRRHLAGCMASVEIGLRLALEGDPEIAAALTPWGDTLCWPMLCAQPSLLAPALLAHMRLRAGISLMLRQSGRPDGAAEDGAEAPPLFPQEETAEGHEAMAALALAEGRWLMTGSGDQPMQPDLPADHFAELLWTTAACLAAVVQRSGVVGVAAVLPAFERAARSLLARHDEAAGPIAAADRLVRHYGNAADSSDILGAALGQRRFLLFVALVARKLRLDSAQVAELLLSGPIEQVAALCRSLGGLDADYRYLLLALRPVRLSLSDAAIVAAADHFKTLDEASADAMIGMLRTPAALRVKLDHLMRVAA